MADNGKPRRTFVDDSGDEWEIRLTYGLRIKLKTEFQFDPLGVFQDQFQGLARLIDDPDRCMQVLYTVLDRQISDRKLQPEQFAHRMDGPTWEAAVTALCRAVFDFFPKPELRKIGHAALDKGLTAVAAAVDKTVELIRDLPVDFGLNGSNDSAGTAPSSPESTATTSA